jgi:hypothetical protein
MNQIPTSCCSGSKRCHTSLALIASALTLTISSHSSASITGTFLGYGAHENWGAGFKTSLAWDATSALTLSTLAFTERRWVVDGESTITWCAQVYQGVSVGTDYTFDVVEMSLVPQTPPSPGPMGFAKAALLSDAMSRWLGADSRVIASAGSANAAAAAFNALLWEVVNDNFATTDLATIASRLSLTTGAFRSNLGGEGLSIYNAMVASLGSGGWQTAPTEGWLSTTAQDQVRVIPAPAVAMMLGLSGCLLAARRRR